MQHLGRRRLREPRSSCTALFSPPNARTIPCVSYYLFLILATASRLRVARPRAPARRRRCRPRGRLPAPAPTPPVRAGPVLLHQASLRLPRLSLESVGGGWSLLCSGGRPGRLPPLPQSLRRHAPACGQSPASRGPPGWARRKGRSLPRPARRGNGFSWLDLPTNVGIIHGRRTGDD